MGAGVLGGTKAKAHVAMSASVSVWTAESLAKPVILIPETLLLLVEAEPLPMTVTVAMSTRKVVQGRVLITLLSLIASPKAGGSLLSVAPESHSMILVVCADDQREPTQMRS